MSKLDKALTDADEVYGDVRTYLRAFGQTVAAARHALGVNTRILAESLDMAASTLNEIEQGKRVMSAEQYERVITWLGVATKRLQATKEKA